MTAFDNFQIATCLIAEGNRAEAVEHLNAAIAQIDADGIDAEMRGDLVALRDMVS